MFTINMVFLSKCFYNCVVLFSVLSGWIAVDKKSLVGVLSERVRKLWDDWELRVLVLISLTLQILLIVLGNRRKYNPGTWLRLFIWSAYLMADWVATVALGVLSHKQGNSGNKTNPINEELMAFWAPFLLLHLGGPDTITAYAIADNELWIRHLLGLVVQTGVALYVTITAWSGTWLSFLTIPMLFAGLVKYGERSLALRCANREQFLDSLLHHPDPGPNYDKFMEEFSLKMDEGFSVRIIEVREVADQSYAGSGENDDSLSYAGHGDNDDSDTNSSEILHDDQSYAGSGDIEDSDPNRSNKILHDSYGFYQIFKRLFVDLILTFQDRDKSQSYFQNSSAKRAFELVEIELGFAYDAFYTKSPITYTKWGCIFRFITSSITIIVFVLFVFVEKSNHLRTDIIITFILLVGAIILDFYAVILLLLSDRTKLWLSPHKLLSCFQRIVSFFLPSNKNRWSNSLAQYNLLSFSLKDKPVPCLGDKRVRKILPFLETLEKHRYEYRWKISGPGDMKNLIFRHFRKKSVDKKLTVESLCGARGGLALKNYVSEFDWSTKVEFDQSILIWHIATDLCYHSDIVGGDPGLAAKFSSKKLSDYMLYLLVMRPFMLPIGIGMIRFRDTCEEAAEFSKEKGLSLKDMDKLRKMLLKVSTEVEPTKVKGDRSKSVLFDGCKLAHQLQEMVAKGKWSEKKKWKFVCNVWIEILGYAASHCRGYYHAQQLSMAGELLTHVWLLMSHLGITEQFQINRGHARVKYNCL